MSRRRAEHAPPPRRVTSLEGLIADLNAELETEFCLAPLPRFSLFVEGHTDRLYLLRAAELAAPDEDLLAVPPQLSPGGERIQILTPGSRGDSSRGGVKQMVRLAKTIAPYVFRMDLIGGIYFVFDHDHTGREGQEEVSRVGFRTDTHSATLNPKFHSGALGGKDVVVEDLLSLRIQERYFAQGTSWCLVTYETGEARRFQWHHQSKGELCRFVRENGNAEDFLELIRLLRRVRQGFGFPTRPD